MGKRVRRVDMVRRRSKRTPDWEEEERQSVGSGKWKTLIEIIGDGDGNCFSPPKDFGREDRKGIYLFGS